MALPIQPGTNSRAGKPCAAGSGLPLIANAISVCWSIALAIGMPREKGSPPSGAASSPYRATYTAPSLTPADSNTSRSRTPVHPAQPTAPRIHCVPPTCGSNRLRPLPAHSRTICMVTCGRQYRSSNVSDSSRSTSPSTRSAHPRRSLLRARSGMPPLLRTKWRAVGVTASSSR